MVRGWKGESPWKVGRGRGGFDQVLWFAVSTRCNHATQMTPQASCLQMAKKPRNFCSFDREIPSSQIFWRLEKATVLKATRRLSCSFLWIPENFLWTKWKMQLLNSPSLICYASAMGFRIRLIYSGKQMRRLDLMNFGQFVHCWTWSELWKSHEQVVSWRFVVIGNERTVIVWLSVTLPCKIFRWWVWVSDHFPPSSLLLYVDVKLEIQ